MSQPASILVQGSDSARKQPTARDDPRQVGVAELDGPRCECTERDQERDVIDPDRELVDDLDEDQRQQDRLCVVDGVGDRQEAQRAHRANVVRRGRHLARRSRSNTVDDLEAGRVGQDLDLASAEAQPGRAVAGPQVANGQLGEPIG